MEKKRQSNFELMRIIMMICIIAHHYVVNSGVIQLFDIERYAFNTYFLAIFGFAGKAMINGFLLISGYFMVKSKFSFNKLLRLYLQIKFYKIVIYLIFLSTGVIQFSIKQFIRIVFNIIYGVNIGFSATFFFLYILMPFINKLIKILNKKNFTVLLLIMLFYFTIISTFSYYNDTFNELGWYIVIYLIGAYISLYPLKKENNKLWLGVAILNILLAVISIIGILNFNNFSNTNIYIYYFVNNANKILAVTLAISMFMFFKNINIKYSQTINVVASATFGVLLIHSNSDEMIKFVWQTLFNVKEQFLSNKLVIYAISTVFIIYVTCTIIELIRIKFLEKPLFKYLSKNSKYLNLCNKVDNYIN